MPTQVLVISVVALLLGALLTFAGYRLFLILLPVWGFVFGFTLGAEATASLFVSGFLANALTFIFALLVGLVFAALSYLFYSIGVLLVAISVGYIIGTGAWAGMGFQPGIGAFIAGVIGAIIVAVLVVAIDAQKLIIVILSAFIGAAMLIAGLLILLNQVPPEALSLGFVGADIRGSTLNTVAWIILALIGIAVQLRVFQPTYVQTVPAQRAGPTIGRIRSS